MCLLTSVLAQDVGQFLSPSSETHCADSPSRQSQSKEGSKLQVEDTSKKKRRWLIDVYKPLGKLDLLRQNSALTGCAGPYISFFTI